MKVTWKKLESRNTRKDPYNLGRFRILLVEDSSFISGLLYSCLREMGVGEVVRATSFETAKDRLNAHNGSSSLTQIDIVLLDWLMPEGDAGDFLKWIRNNKRDSIRFVPVIVCSGYTDTQLVTMSRDLGANEVMVKPVSAEKIAERILRIIDQPRPYLQSPTFSGPDRRRRSKPFKEERRFNKPKIIYEEEE